MLLPIIRPRFPTGSWLTRGLSTMTDLTITSTYKMHTGYEMPVLGFGVYQTPKTACEPIVAAALRQGYRHVDSAIVYRNEAACGAAIHASDIPRADIFFTTKIQPYRLGHDEALQQVADSLERTGLDYLDLVLINAPYGTPASRAATWTALRRLQREGKVRSIGVSNYGLHHLRELAAQIESLGPDEGGRIDVGQWELHPWLMRPDIVRFCREHGTVVQAWSPLVRGQRFGREKVLAQVAAATGRTEAQVLLRWSLQRGFVPLVKTVHEERVKENAGIFGWEIADEDMKQLDTDEYSPCSWDPTVAE